MRDADWSETSESAEEAAPQSAIVRVRRLWTEALGVEIGDVDANFFEVGGHSLLLLVLQEGLEELAGRRIQLEELFESTTIRTQAALLAGPTGPASVPTQRARTRSLLLERTMHDDAGKLS